MRLLILSCVFLVAACSSPVVMRHPITGQTVQCGPYPGGVNATASAIREGQCINDFKEQGYVRVSN